MLPSENLPELIERLRTRIQISRGELQSGEAVTRYALVDPLLRALGWDTSNPDMVWPEYDFGDGSKADYVLRVDGKPYMVVEAKSLGTDLADAIDQAVSYCVKEGIDYFAVTNGDRWEIYETPQEITQSPKRLAEFSLVRMPPDEVWMSASRLSREFANGYVLGSGGTQPLLSQVPSEDDADWRTLTAWSRAKGKHESSEMKFPDGSRAEVHSRTDLVVNTAKWLIDNDLLNDDLLPIASRGSARRGTRMFIVATQPEHESGSPMEEPLKVGRYYVDVKECVHGSVGKAKKLMELASQDSSAVKIRYL